MIVQFTLMIVIVLMLAPVAIPADGQGGSASRWGITTKKNMEDIRKTTPDESGSERETQTPSTVVRPSVGSPATSALDKADTPPMAPEGNAPAPAGDAAKAKPPKKSAAAPDPKKITPQIIHWSGEQQKNRCNGYLEELRSLFLQTRHYSIQGASCETEKSAAAFLKSMATCQQDCPQGLLEYSGYTDRIIRNIRYLKKLGNDRCSGFLTPNPPMTTQTP
jgi:hypothetical protein